MSIEGVAQASGSSTATITRFVRAAGYNGFSEFREKIVSDYQIASGDFGEGAKDPAAADFADSTLHRLLTGNVRNIQDAISNIEPQTAGMFVDALTVARRIIILGSGASHYAAAYLEEGLALYTEKNVSNVLLRGATQYSNNVIRTISDGDVVVAISKPRYSNSTVELTKVAKTRGAKVLVITDSPTSPLAPLADVIFFAPAKSRLLPNSPAAIFAFADALIATIAGKSHRRSKLRPKIFISEVWLNGRRLVQEVMRSPPGATNLPIDVVARKSHVKVMHMETFIRISRLIDQARSVTRSRQH
ncbi:MurR/RpiR family transcriptional regulator [Ensifer sp. SSB1]|uniref:MurR/RpiR family transcriptional regulator n=1 Tax=Ensifer sp. SSB1 TaxID=2795385 RepID=UPI0025C2587A|nr:MurR/RpiR family transcriptional regulator [Ensifer sp. SSB1]